MTDKPQSLFFETPAAGRGSSRQFTVTEPPILRKRKEEGHAEKRTHVMDHEIKEEESGSLAMRYKVGYRRADSYPATEYQYQYAWKPSQMEGVSPIMAAATPAKENKAPPTTLLREKAKKQGETKQGETKQREIKQRRILKDSNAMERGDKSKEKHPALEKLKVTGTEGKPTKPTNNKGDPQEPALHEGPPPHDGTKPCQPVESMATNKKGKKVKTHQDGHTVKMIDTGSPKKYKEPPIIDPAPVKKTKEKHKGRRGEHTSSPSYPLVTEYRAQFDPKYRPSKDEDIPISASGMSYREDVPIKEVIYGMKDDSSGQQKQTAHINKSPSRFSPATEYSSNFISPVQCQYTKGSWLGAAKPDLYVNPLSRRKLPTTSTNDYEVTSIPVSQSNESDSSWYNQVLELRKKAEEYKIRGDSSHRNHLVFLEEDEDSQSGPVSDSPDSMYNHASTNNNNDEEEEGLEFESVSDETDRPGISTHDCICTPQHHDTILVSSNDDPITPSSHCIHCHTTPTPSPKPPPHPHPPPTATATATANVHSASPIVKTNKKTKDHKIPQKSTRPVLAYSSAPKPSTAYSKTTLNYPYTKNGPIKPPVPGRTTTQQLYPQSTPLVYSRPHLTPPSSLSSFNPSPLSPPSHYRSPTLLHQSPARRNIPRDIPAVAPSDSNVPMQLHTDIHSQNPNIDLDSDLNTDTNAAKPSISCHICDYNGPLDSAAVSHPLPPLTPRQSCTACNTCHYTGLSSSLKPTHFMTHGIAKSKSSNCNLCLSALDQYKSRQSIPSNTNIPSHPSHHKEQDSYSISSISVASSVSVASDVLAKARQRKKFWSEHATAD